MININEVWDFIKKQTQNHLYRLILYNLVSQQIKQLNYFKPLEKGKLIDYKEILPKFWVAKQDKAKLLAVFVEGGPQLGRVFLHLVFNDEYCPIPVIDQIYRKIREIWFGRHADVESIEIRIPIIGPIMKPIPFFTDVYFYTTWSSYFQPYLVSFHHTALEKYQWAIYSNTWNHLMTAGPSPTQFFVYYNEHKPNVYIGSRLEAEEYARKLS